MDVGGNVRVQRWLYGPYIDVRYLHVLIPVHGVVETESRAAVCKAEGEAMPDESVIGVEEPLSFEDDFGVRSTTTQAIAGTEASQ